MTILDEGKVYSWIENELLYAPNQTREFDKGYQPALKKLMTKLRSMQHEKALFMCHHFGCDQAISPDWRYCPKCGGAL